MLLTTFLTTTCACAHFTANKVHVVIESTTASYYEGQERFLELLTHPRYPYVKCQRKRNRFNTLYGKKNATMIERHMDERRSKNRNENETRSKHRNEKKVAHKALWAAAEMAAY